MFRKVISCIISAFITMVFSIDAAYPSEVGRLTFGQSIFSGDDTLRSGVMMAGLFAPSTMSKRKRPGQRPTEPQPVSPSPEATDAQPAVTTPQPQESQVPAATPSVIPSQPPASPVTTQPDQSPSIQTPAAPALQAPPVSQPESVQPVPQPVPSVPLPPPSQPVPASPPVTIQPAPAAPARAPMPVTSRAMATKKGDVSFNFDDADVYSVIQTIFGDVLRVNYIIDPRVKGRVNFRSVAPVAKEDVLPLMEVILRLNGVGIVEEGGLYRIVPIADLPKEPAPVGLGRDSEQIVVTGKARLQVVPIKYIQSTEMTRILTPFLSTSAVIVDVPKSNHIVIIDTDANVKRLLQLVDTFDNEVLKQVTPRVFVYAVQNSKAKDVAALLQQIFQKGGASTAPKTTATATGTTTTQRPPIPGQPTPPATPSPQISVGGQSTGEQLVSEITKIIPDEVTNSIVILATPDDYAFILDTIQKIDIMPRQVLIEALIVDVTLTDNLSFGLSYQMLTDLKITGLKPFKNPVDLHGPASVNSGGLDQSKLSGKGFTFVGSDPSGNVRAVLTALDDRSRGKVVAAPHLLVSDNREARIQVGQQIPIATSTSSQPVGTTVAGSTTTAIPVVATSTIQYKDIGIILKVKPQVNDSGLIALELSQEISSISAKPVTVGGLDEVSIDKTEATSNLVARDGETIIIGGLIREDTSHATTGFPFLSRIPILGALFGTTDDIATRKETIILLTPHVIRNQQEARGVTSDYIDRYKSSTNDKELDKFINRGRKEEPEKKQPEKEQPPSFEPVPNSGN
jgi:type II secretory pathway component GspD/PulD (secretin)